MKVKWGADGQTPKKIETDGSCAFWELVSLTVYQISFLLFVTFDIILGRHICLTHLAMILSFTSYFSSFIANTDVRTWTKWKWNIQPWHKAFK